MYMWYPKCPGMNGMKLWQTDLPYPVINSVQVHHVEGGVWFGILELPRKKLHPGVIANKSLQVCTKHVKLVPIRVETPRHTQA